MRANDEWLPLWSLLPKAYMACTVVLSCGCMRHYSAACKCLKAKLQVVFRCATVSETAEMTISGSLAVATSGIFFWEVTSHEAWATAVCRHCLQNLAT